MYPDLPRCVLVLRNYYLMESSNRHDRQGDKIEPLEVHVHS